MAVHTAPRPTDHGLLTAGGTDMLHAVVHTSPVPTRPPEALAETVRAVRDVHDRLVDWELASSDPGHRVTRAAVDGFHDWRSTFTYERALGERALASTFVAWAARRTATSTLSVLARPAATLAPPATIHLKWQLDQARQAYASSPDSAVALFDAANGNSPIRGFLADEVPTVVLASRELAVTAGAAGIQIHWAGTGDLSTLTGWRRDASGLTLFTPEGDVVVSSPTAADLISDVGHGHDVVSVRPIPVHRLFAPLAASLGDAASLAMTCRTGLSLYSGWRTGSRH